MKELFPGVYRRGSQIFTKNLVKGLKSYGRIVTVGKEEYRIWDPWHSKPAAAIMNGLRIFPIKKDSKILYLGIASGSTASFFSDIVGPDGVIYGVEISERSIRDLNPLAEKRKNIVPILANAREPDTYSWVEPADIVYQDAATDDQSEILIRNCQAFLKKGGQAMIAIKARSINVVKRPAEIYQQEINKLKKHFDILDKRQLDPFEKDHMLLVMKWK